MIEPVQPTADPVARAEPWLRPPPRDGVAEGGLARHPIAFGIRPSYGRMERYRLGAGGRR